MIQIFLINGSPGDPIVSFHHLKQPSAEAGPFKIIHDQTAGRSSIWQATDLVQLAKQPGGITAVDAAKALYETDEPKAADKQKARRRLNHLVEIGLLVVLQEGDSGSKTATTWGSK